MNRTPIRPAAEVNVTVAVICKRGFSLIELMIVLVILVTIAAIAVPNLQRSFQRNELRDATRLLQESLGELRQEAIQTGRPLIVQFGWDSASLRVFRDADWRSLATTTESSGIATRESVQSLPDARNGVDDSRRNTWESTDLQLPTDARFSLTRVTLDVATDNSSALLDRSALGDSGEVGFGSRSSGAPSARGAADGSTDIGSPVAWSKPVVLLPNGSVDELHFWIHLDRRWQCPVLWRGATGQLEVGPAQRVTESTAASELRVTQ